MPLPKITEEILLAGLPVKLGFSLLELTGIRSAAAKSGAGVNYFFEFVAVCGPNTSDDNKGRKVTYMLYGPSLTGDFDDAKTTYRQMLCALTNLSGKDLVGVEVEEDKLIGLKCWADIQERTQDGKVYKDFKGFYPEDNPPF